MAFVWTRNDRRELAPAGHCAINAVCLPFYS